MERDEQRRTNYEIAEAIASGWERRRAFIEATVSPVREWLLRELAPQSGDTVLELAAGAGDTGFEVAAIVGERGHLISTDFSPAMIEVARRRGTVLGVGNAEYRVVDAEDIDLDDASVDGAVCRYAYMLMADPEVALAETRRVLRPGGRLALAVWGAPERNPFFASMAMTLVEAGHLPPPDPGGPGVFNMASEDRTRGLLEGAGFGAVRSEEVPVRFAFTDVEEYLSIVTDTAGPIALALRGLSDNERDAVTTKLREAFAPFVVAGGYEVPGVTLCAVAS